MSAPLRIPTEPDTPFHRVAAAIEARLRLGFPETIFSFALMSPSPTVKELERVLSRKPFLGLAFVDVACEPLSRQLKGKAKWQLLVAVENTMGAAQRYKGDTRGIGLWGALACAAGLLHGWSVPDTGAMRVSAIDTVHPDGWGDDAVAMGLVSHEVDFALDMAPGAEADLADFLRLNASWMVPGAAIPALTTNIRGA